jgi:hypothetical protein
MTVMTRRFAITVVVLLATAPAAAQQRGTIEVGLLARGTLFDPSLEVATAIGVGGRAAVFLAPHWLLEADLSMSGVDGLASLAETSYRPLHVRVNFLRRYSDRGRMVLGLGLVATSFGGDFGESDAGVAGLFGFGIDASRALVARADATLDYMPTPANGAGDNWNAGLQIGLGYRFGRQ